MGAKLGTDTIRCKNCGTLNTSAMSKCVHCEENPYDEPTILRTEAEKKGWKILKDMEN